MVKSSKAKLRYQKKYNARPDQIKYRMELNRENRRRGTYGNGDKMDVSHKNGKIVGLEHQSSNRSRNGKGSVHRRSRK
jgi:hypothetical protein